MVVMGNAAVGVLMGICGGRAGGGGGVFVYRIIGSVGSEVVRASYG